MKNWILRASAVGLAAILSGAIACGGSGGGCGGSSGTTDTNTSTVPSMTCGSGTHLEGSQCVPNTMTCASGSHLEGSQCVQNIGIGETSEGSAAAPKRL